MTHYILVAGAWHGGWCWEAITPLLEAAGHRVSTPELHDAMPGRDGALPTLGTWGEQVAELTRADGEPVVLVGHSRGGTVISEAAERAPDRIKRLVYVAAYLLADGESIEQASLAHRREQPVFAPGPPGTVLVRPDAVKDVFYNRTDEGTSKRAQERLVPEPIASFTTPIHVSADRFGRIPRAYVECVDDCAVPLELQRAMQRSWPCDPVFTLETDHSPFYSDPAALGHVLLALDRPS